MPPTDSNKAKPSILKSTREAKGLTIEIVHEATKIPMDALRAIEEGYSVRILSPFYYRGFIKIYAEFLGLDVKEMYQQYGLDQPVKAASVSVTNSIPSKAKPTRQVVVTPPQPNVILEQIQEGLSAVLKPKNLKLLAKILGFIFLIFVLLKMGGCIASHLHKKTNTPKRISTKAWSEKKVEAPRESENTQEDIKSVPVPPPPVKHEVVQAQSSNNKVEVAVRATRNTWIQVKSDGKVVFQMTLTKGSMESWDANDRIELSGRNIDQLDMEVNGKHIGTLGDSGRRVRRVLITQEGLTVKK